MEIGNIELIDWGTDVEILIDDTFSEMASCHLTKGEARELGTALLNFADHGCLPDGS